MYRIAHLPPELEKLCDFFEAKYPGLSLAVYENEFRVYIQEIRFPPDMQSQGFGTEVVEKVKEYATKVGKPISLHPEPEPRKKKKLFDFYKDRGFVHNKGRKTDYRLTEPFARTMYWKPPGVV